MLGAVGKQFQNGKSEQEHWRTFDYKYPLPAAESRNTIHVEKQRGHRAAENKRRRDADDDYRRQARAIGGWEPKGQVIHHAWEEAGFRGPQKKSQDVELRRPPNESRRCGEHSPQRHD